MGLHLGMNQIDQRLLVVLQRIFPYRFWRKANNFRGLFEFLPHYVATIKLHLY